MARGAAESSWLVIRRCLALLRRLQRGPADWAELVRAVLLAEGPDAYGHTEGQALRKRLYRDIEHLRSSLEVTIEVDRTTAEYHLLDLRQPLLDLPDEQVRTLFWLEETFAGETPQANEVQP